MARRCAMMGARAPFACLLILPAFADPAAAAAAPAQLPPLAPAWSSAVDGSSRRGRLLQSQAARRRGGEDEATASEQWSSAGSAAVLRSPCVVFVTVGRTGHRVTVTPTGEVHAKWNHKGSWQQILLEREHGFGELRSGDAVFLTSWIGKRLTIAGHAADAEADLKGEKQRFVVHRKGGEGPIAAGDTVFLEAWTGAMVDADAPGASGAVQARWDHRGSWQELALEALTPAGVPAAPPIPAKIQPEAFEHLQLINRLRALGHTCPGGERFEPNPAGELTLDCRLWRAAALHSRDMALSAFVGHASPDGRSPADRASEQGAAAHGEVVIAGPPSAQESLDRLMASDSHCRHIMRSEFKSAAVGYAQGGIYRHYWTALFSADASEASESSASCHPPESQ